MMREENKIYLSKEASILLSSKKTFSSPDAQTTRNKFTTSQSCYQTPNMIRAK